MENLDVDKKNSRVNSITKFTTKTFEDGVAALRELSYVKTTTSRSTLDQARTSVAMQILDDLHQWSMPNSRTVNYKPSSTAE